MRLLDQSIHYLHEDVRGGDRSHTDASAVFASPILHRAANACSAQSEKLFEDGWYQAPVCHRTAHGAGATTATLAAVDQHFDVEAGERPAAAVANGSARTLVVMPTYNERENLERVVGAVRRAGFDVLVVDDSSPDGTGEIARCLAESDPGVTLVVRPGKLGLGSAYVQGFRVGLERGYEYLVEMDADGSHRPEFLPAIVAEASRSGGLAIGSRYIAGGGVSGWSWSRRLLSWAANVYCRALLRLPVHDCTSGYRCYPKTVVESVGLDRVLSQGYSFQIEMVYRCLRRGHAVREVPIHFEDRVAGRSKVSQGEVRKALLAVLRLRLLGVG
jgi:hypothetical protein